METTARAIEADRNNSYLPFVGQAALRDAAAAHVTRLSLVSNRIVVSAMEPRSAIGHYDAVSDRYTLHAGSQGVFGLKHQMAELLKIKPSQVRVLTGPQADGSNPLYVDDSPKADKPAAEKGKA